MLHTISSHRNRLLCIRKEKAVLLLGPGVRSPRSVNVKELEKNVNSRITY